MHILIHQGSAKLPKTTKITIIIDVIRAFTVAHYAFLQGIKRIMLAETVEQAFQIKMENPDFLLAGEVDGLPIEGFDLDNSPYHISQKSLAGKTLVQKTTNGVRATLNCLTSEHLFVTGYTNAKITAQFVKENFKNAKQNSVTIVASHPSGDDDLACAEYIKSILDGDRISAKKVIERIKHSHAAKKFYEKNASFLREDIDLCAKELDTDFVMKVNKNDEMPMIERVNVW